MGLFRVIIYGFIIWLIAKFIGIFFRSPVDRTTVEGQAKDPDPLDLKNADVEDADFEEIDE
ncbi:hypothetical protein B6D60_05975 [candidate division KSB1 bacterium 4484_87]|nr:MAG: hypothetical protein B6D60_05975 [candidate division KSB1 bacterium 4484_87]